MEITINLSGTKALIEKFNKLEAKLKNFSPEFRTIGSYLTSYFSSEVFLSRGSVLGNPWAPLAESTLKEKMKKYPGRGPLEASGDMRNEFRSDEGPMELKITNASPHFKYHQSKLPRKSNLPRRVMLGFNGTIKTKIKDVFTEGISRVIQ